jgi:hypothetical protein
VSATGNTKNKPTCASTQRQSRTSAYFLTGFPAIRAAFYSVFQLGITANLAREFPFTLAQRHMRSSEFRFQTRFAASAGGVTRGMRTADRTVVPTTDLNRVSGGGRMFRIIRLLSPTCSPVMKCAGTLRHGSDDQLPAPSAELRFRGSLAQLRRASGDRPRQRR